MLHSWSVSHWNRLFVIVLLGGILFIAATRVQPNDALLTTTPPDAIQQNSAAQVDRRAPDFTLTDLAGAPVNLNALKGQVVLINIWATWCPPCRSEMPALQAAYEQYHERGFTILAVNQAEDSDSVTAFMQQYRLTFAALLDRDSAVSRAYQVRVLPSSFFVDRRGNIRVVYIGPIPHSVLNGTIEQLLQEGS